MFRYVCKRVFPVQPLNEKSSFLVPLIHSPFSTTVDGDKHVVTEPISLLMSVFAVPYESALSIAARSKLKSKDKIVGVHRVLSDFGFSKEQMRELAVKQPRLFRFKLEATLKPKLEFFRSAGFGTSEIADIYTANPNLFCNSLERKIVPCLSFLKTIIPTRDAMVHVLKTNSRCFLPEHAQNIEVLRRHGVDEHVIWKMFTSLSRSCSRDIRCFTEAFQKVRELGVEPESPTFGRALGVLCYMSKSTWERKVALYKSLGWSDDEVGLLFTTQPTSFAISDEVIKRKMDFFVNSLGWDTEFLSSHPTVMHLSLHKRVIPRCSVMNVLMSRGLIKKKTKLASWLLISEKTFSDRYVDKYKEDVPEVLEAYNGKLPFEGWL